MSDKSPPLIDPGIITTRQANFEHFSNLKTGFLKPHLQDRLACQIGTSSITEFHQVIAIGPILFDSMISFRLD